MERPMRKINVKVFVTLVAGTAAFVAVLFAVHYFQNQRIARALLWQARKAEEQNHSEQVVRYLERYLEFAPRDIEERAHLGRTLAGDAFAGLGKMRQRALLVLDQVITSDPGRADERRLLVKVALELRNLKAARDSLEVLLPEKGPQGGSGTAAEQAELEGYWAQLCDYEQKPREAIAWCRKAIDRCRDLPKKDRTTDEQSHWVRLAYLLRRDKALDAQTKEQNVREADALIDELVERNRESYQVYLARWRYRRDFDLLRADSALDPAKLKEAAEDVAEALAREPEGVDVLLASADLARLQGKRDKAREYLDRGLKLQETQGYRGASDAARFQLLWHLASLLLETRPEDLKDGQTLDGVRADAAEVIKRIRKTRGQPAAADYLQARLLMQQRRWNEATALLEGARVALVAQTDLVTQINLYLGQCYEQLEDPEQVVGAYQEVAKADPGSVVAQLGMGAARWSQGRLEEALGYYRTAADLGGMPARGWVDVARLEIEKALQSDKPEWTKAEAALERAAQAAPEAVDVPLLRAEVLMAREEFKEAETLLLAARKAQPDKVELWAALADVALRRKDRDGARAAIAEAEKALGDRVELRLARARLLGGETGEGVSKALLALEQNGGRFKGEDRAKLLSGLASAQFRAGAFREARRLWEELGRQPEYQHDLRLKLLLFDLALKDGDRPGMERALEEVRKAERRQGMFSQYGEALRLIWLARQTQDTLERTEALDKARLLLDKALSQRTDWAAVWVARAEIAELQGNPEQAITHLRQALAKGDTSLAVVKRLVSLLVERHRNADAAEVIAQRRQALLRNADLGRLAAWVALREGNHARAIEHALAAVKEDSTDPKDLTWLGTLLAAAGKPTEAEQKLREAVKAAKTDPGPVVALVQFLANNNRQGEANIVIDQAKANLPPRLVPLTLAQCYEALSLHEKARTQYLEALEKARDDIVVVRSVASYLLRSGRIAEAEPLLRRVYNREVRGSDSDVEWARRGLAVVLAGGTDYRRFREALKLVGVSLDANGQLPRESGRATDSTENQRIRARVMATQPQRQFRERAIELLEGLDNSQALMADDVFVLALLYDAGGANDKATKLLNTLVTNNGQSAQYRAQYIQFLLRRREFAEALTQVEQLEELEKQRSLLPNTYGTVELRVRALEGLDRGDEALTLLKEYVDRPRKKAPEEVLLVVAALSRQKKHTEAFGLLEEAWKKCRPDVPPEKRCRPETVGGVSVAVLKAMQPTKEQCARVEGWIKDAIRHARESEKKPGENRARVLTLSMHLADLYDQLGQYPEAEEAYRRVLKDDQEGGNVVAMNNLAWLLALRTGNGKEAKPLIDVAIAGMGRRPELLDTRGLVYLALENPEAALADFKEATADAPTATRLYHLARAHKLTGDKEGAARVLAQAKKLGLEPAKLHPVEQQTCRTLLAELKVQ
jgi:predicted Zn-dependent protease